MPDFDARVHSGCTVETWDDHAPLVSRLNPIPEISPKYYRAVVGQQVTIAAWVGGWQAPLDETLGGRLFSMDFGEHPCRGPIATTSPAGQSSLQRFTPPVVGHYLVFIRRGGGGAIGFHIDAEAP